VLRTKASVVASLARRANRQIVSVIEVATAYSLLSNDPRPRIAGRTPKNQANPLRRNVDGMTTSNRHALRPSHNLVHSSYIVGSYTCAGAYKLGAVIEVTSRCVSANEMARSRVRRKRNTWRTTGSYCAVNGVDMIPVCALW